MFKTDSFWALVDQIMEMVESVTEYPVLIYDTNGHIIRATDRTRIGNIHPGAQKVVCGKVPEYAVTSEEAAQNPLVREGFNCPIKVEGHIVAGLGITGELAVATPVARLAAKMIEAWIEKHNYQTQLERSERKYRDIFDHSLHGIYQVTLEGRFLTANNALADILGYPDPETLIETITDIGDQLYSLPEDRQTFLEAIQKVGQVSDFETKFRYRDGGVIHVRIDARLKTDSTTNNAFIEGLLEDITEKKRVEADIRKKMEEALERNANFTRALLNAVPTPVFYKDKEGLYQGCNQAFSDVMGVTSDEIQGKAVHELWPSEHAEVYHRKDLELMENPEHQVYEFMVKDKNGEIRPVIYAKDVFRDENGAVAGLVGAFLDITELKRTEEELRKANDIINRSPVVAFCWKNAPGWPVEYVSENAADLFGHAAADFISGNTQYVSTVHPDDLKRVAQEVQQASEDEGTTNFNHEPYRIVTKNGEIKWVNDQTQIRRDSQGTIIHYEGIVSDITDRRQAEEALNHLRNRQIEKLNREIGERKRAQQSQLKTSRMLRLVLDSIPVRVFWKDRECNFLGCNQPFADDAGRDNPSELIGLTDFDFPWTRQEAEAFRADDKAVMRSGEQKLRFEEPQTHSDGVTRWLQTNKIPMRNLQGKIIGVLGTYEDITERKEAERELQRLRNYLVNIIDSMPSVLIGVDNAGRVTQWNQQAEIATGLTPDSAKQRDLTQAFPRLGKETARIKKAIQDHKVIRDIKIPHELEGETRYEDLTIFPLVGDGDEGAVIRLDDVTERVRLEDLMIQNEKMVSVGGLAAGMAHEINNPLAGVLQNASVLRNRLLGDMPANQKAADQAGISLAALREYAELRKLPQMVEAISSSGLRANSIVKNTLGFARKSDRTVSSHDLRALLDQTIDLAKTDYDMKKKYDFKKIRIEKEYDSENTIVNCEASKIQQVFLNLLKNGAEAMAGIGIEVSKAKTDPNKAPKFILRIKQSNAYVRTEIEDNGPGVSEQRRRQIFEPFYTTKPVGKGTGLGLSVSYFIITEDHGGEMWVEPGQWGGTRFVIQLPTGH